MENIAAVFGRRVRLRRKKLGLSQERLAELCELHPTYIGQLERGEKNASLETVLRVCKGLDTSPSMMFDNISPDGMRTTAQEIYEIVSEFSEKDQKAVLEIIKHIKSIAD